MYSLTLNDGTRIPQLGFGTCAIGAWQQDDSYVTDIILQAMAEGYRHFDTASLYGNERALGRAIKQSGISRDDFYIVSKVWDTEQGYDNTLAAFERSCARLDLDYVNLYLIHWPVPELTQQTWQAMEKLHADGKVKSLGLSNFRHTDIQQLLQVAKVKPVYNQLELHPYLTQKALVDFCEKHDIVVSCWSPLGSGTWSGVAVKDKPIMDSLIVDLAKQHGVSAGQIILKWDVQQGRIVIPKAESATNIRNNFKLEGFELSAAELASIDALNRDHRYGGDPDSAYKDNITRPVPA